MLASAKLTHRFYRLSYFVLQIRQDFRYRFPTLGDLVDITSILLRLNTNGHVMETVSVGNIG